ncbi:Ig-like domain-containing protein [Agarilytica rhodophyticola]|uniref:Ig-like domain-containing protein n=1 Tax=Agarilytica rhodophyticola TaxID=1737490 RepID=UPI000B343CE6|nr:Ig-like domain-containing protein [Agarilytica rhodophyticola]
MLNKRPLAVAIGFVSAIIASGLSNVAFSQTVKVDINANVKHSVNGVSNFGRERRITIHASPIENEWIGEKDKLDYLMSLGVHFGRDTGTPMYYFGQTKGDRSRSTPPGQGDPFPWGHPDHADLNHVEELADEYHFLLTDKFKDAIPYYNRTESMIMSSQPRPAFPNWSSYSWFGGALGSDDPWRPRTFEQAGEWYAKYLEEFHLRNEGDPQTIPMPKYWEVVNEPDMQMNTTGPEGHLSTWEELFRYHNVVADVIREKLGDKAPKIGGMTWGLHDFHLGDSTAFGAPRLANDTLLNAFYGNDAGSVALKNVIRDGIFAESETMGMTTSTPWYQWDVIWKRFLDVAGANMDFYSIHIYDWPKWQTDGARIRSGLHSEGMIDMLEWYDGKILGQRKEVIVSEYGAVSGKYLTQGTELDRSRMRWEKLKPFSQMLMQFLERPDYIVSSLPFIVVKGQWGDEGKEAPYAQSLLDRDYSTCDETATAYINCTWNFNPAIKWYELWQDVEGTRIDTYSTDRDVQVDAYVNSDNGEHHMYVIVNSLHTESTNVDLSFAGVNNNSIKSIRMRHLYLDEQIDVDNNPNNGMGKPVLADAYLNSLPENVTVGGDATIILDIEYADAVSLPFESKETKYHAEPLTNQEPYRVSTPAVLMTQINGVHKPAQGEAQLRITGAFFLNNQFYTDSSDSRVFLKVNGNDVEFDADWRGEDQVYNKLMGTMEIPVPIEYLSDSSNNTIEFATLAAGEAAAISLQVWDMDTQISRSVEADCVSCISVSSFAISKSGTQDIGIDNSIALVSSFSPINASNKQVNWTSSNPSIASVDANGLVTGNNEGNVTITATTVDGALTDSINIRIQGSSTPAPTPIPTILPTPTPTPSPVDTVVVEMESFTDTNKQGAPVFGDTVTGFRINGTYVDFNTSGDWAEYSVNFSNTGTYRADIFAASPMTGDLGVRLMLNNTEVGSSELTSTQGWTDFQKFSIGNITVPAPGRYTLRVQSFGSSPWQWNGDSIVFESQ